MPELQSGNVSWVDILPPGTPETMLSPWLWPGFILLVVAAAFIIYRWQHLPRQRALQQLKQIHHQLQQVSSSDYRQLAFNLSYAIKNGLNIRHFDHNNDNPDWREFSEKLTRCCFQTEPPSHHDIQQLVEQAYTWLRG